MPAGGFRTFVAGETLDEDKINDFLMQGVLVFADSAARGSAIASPVHGQVSFLKDTNSTEFYDGSQWEALGIGNGVATGGDTSSTITVGGVTYTLLTFTSGSGTLTVTKAGLFDFLIVGGGGGGVLAGGFAAGGGAGGVITGTIYLDVNATVVVGAGGTGSTTVPTNGSDSFIISPTTGDYPKIVTALGGGRSSTSSGVVGANGGSGGGGIANNFAGGISLNRQGRDGGTATTSTTGGGGGGATGAGANGGVGTGGTGLDVSTFISGSTLVKAAGGSGAPTAINGAANSGNGGSASGNGGSGIVYIRFEG